MGCSSSSKITPLECETDANFYTDPDVDYGELSKDLHKVTNKFWRTPEEMQLEIDMIKQVREKMLNQMHIEKIL